MKNNKILVIGDLHFRERIGYADYVADGREQEVADVLNKIIKTASVYECGKIVFVGDGFHSKNNPSSVIKSFVRFIERFDDTAQMMFLAGNHEKFGDGRSAIDFLTELNNPLWTVASNKVIHMENESITLCPYFHNTELGVTSFDEAKQKIFDMLPGGMILFMHHAIAGTETASDYTTDLFEEVVFSREELLKKYTLVVAGHIHKEQYKGNVLVTGSVFNDQVGEEEKAVWVVDTENVSIERIKLPARPIIKLENPTPIQLSKLTKNSIVKVVLTDVNKKGKRADAIRESLKEFDGGILVEQYPHERKQSAPELENQDIADLSIEKLLEAYAKQTGIDLEKLQRGWQLIQ